MKTAKNSPEGASTAAPTVSNERRRFHQARAVFENAYTMLEPFMQPDTGWHGRSLQHLSALVVGQNFPQLAQEEVRALIDAVPRVFAERYSSGAAPA